MDTIVNKVAASGLITLNLNTFQPDRKDIKLFDLKEYLFQELILREKDLREALPKVDWSVYKNKYVAVTCTADAIIPMWAYMLVATYLEPYAALVYEGTAEELHKELILKHIDAIHGEDYQDKMVVVKGCEDKSLPAAAFLAIAVKLQPYVRSLMYGEPCSTVPVYKRKKV